RGADEDRLERKRQPGQRGERGGERAEERRGADQAGRDVRKDTSHDRQGEPCRDARQDDRAPPRGRRRHDLVDEDHGADGRDHGSTTAPMIETGAAVRAASSSTTWIRSRSGGRTPTRTSTNLARSTGSATNRPTTPASSRTAGTIAKSAA